MRLFIAIEFSDSIKEELLLLAARLKAFARCGHFTAKEHLHLTLAFLGELSYASLPAILEAMTVSAGKAFPLKISGLDAFCRGNEFLYFLSTEHNPSLLKLHSTLTAQLAEANIAFDPKPFRPHITLARHCKMTPNFSSSQFAASIKPIAVSVDHITLMHSQRRNGKLSYTPLAKIPLHCENAAKQ